MTIDRSRYPGVPEDFPIEEVVGAVPGAQPKYLMVEEGGRFYPTGTSPSEVQDALEVCLDLKAQLSDYCVRHAQQGDATRVLLLRVHQYLLQNGWCFPSQSHWICAQIAKELEWELPPELQEGPDGLSSKKGGNP